MKKLERIGLMAATGVLAVGMTGCSGKEKTDTEVKQETTQDTDVESKETVWTETDIEPAVAGIGNLAVIEGAEDPNLLHGITYDGEIVKSMEADTDADFNKPGTYKVTYKVTVHAEKLAEYLAEKNTGKEMQYTVEEQADIQIEKDLTVVDSETAADMADKGQVVIGSGDKTVPKSDGSFVKEPLHIPESVKEKGTYPVDAGTKKEITEETGTETILEPDNIEPDKEDATQADTKASEDPGQSANSNEKPASAKNTGSSGSKNQSSTHLKNNGSSGTANKNSSSSSSTANSSTANSSTGSSSTVNNKKPSNKPSGKPSGKPSNETSGNSSSRPNSSSNTSGSSSGTANNSGSSEQKHTHTWVQQYKTEIVPAKTHTVHHDAEYKTVHHDAVTHEEGIYEPHQICNNCGKDFGPGMAACDAAIDHSGEFGHSYRSEPVRIGTKTVVDEEAYDEQVLVKEAYDETVVDSPETKRQVPDGYLCSECGARK